MNYALITRTAESIVEHISDRVHLLIEFIFIRDLSFIVSSPQGRNSSEVLSIVQFLSTSQYV